MKTLHLISILLLGLTINLFSQTVPTNGLVAWYPFNGNANDQSGNNLNGVVNGASLTTDRFGNLNSAYEFDGVNDFIEIAHSALLNFDINEDFTLSVWVLADVQINNNPTGDIIAKWEDFPGGNNESYPYSIRIQKENPQGIIQMMRYDKSCGNFASGKSNSSVINNNWHHLAFVKSGNDLKIYVDCSLERVFLDITNCTTLNNSPLFIGKRGGTLNPAHYKGKIDDVIFFNRALNDCELGLLCSSNKFSNYSIVKKCRSDVITINSSLNSSQHFWYLEDSLISTSRYLVVNSEFPVLYILNSVDEKGCVHIDSFDVKILELLFNENNICVPDSIPIFISRLFIPNVITPNGDNYNDCFEILYLSKFRSNQLEIFNRYGRKVFSQNFYSQNWCAQNLPSGTYFYHLKLNEGQINYKGFVEVIK